MTIQPIDENRQNLEGIKSDPASGAPPPAKTIHEAAINWATQTGLMGTDMSEAVLSAKLVAAGLGKTIFLSYNKEFGYQFKKEDLIDKIIRWFTAPLDVIVSEHQKGWEKKGRESHIAAFEALEAFQKIGERANSNWSEKDFENDQQPEIDRNRAKQADAAAAQVERRSDRLNKANIFAGKLYNKVTQLDEQLNNCNSAVNRLERQNANVLRERGFETFRLQELETGEQRIEKIIGGNESEIRSLKQSNVQTRKEIDQDQIDLSKLSIALKEEQANLTKLQGQSIFTRSSDEIKECKETIAKLEKNMEAIGSKITSSRELIKTNLGKIAEIERKLAGPFGNDLKVTKAKIAEQQKVVADKTTVLDANYDKIKLLKDEAGRIAKSRDNLSYAHDELYAAIRSISVDDSYNPNHTLIKAAFEKAQKLFPDIDTPLPRPAFMEPEERRYGEFLKPEPEIVVAADKDKSVTTPSVDVPKPELTAYQQRRENLRKNLDLINLEKSTHLSAIAP